MRRLLVVGFNALQFQRLHGVGLALNLLFQTFKHFDLLDDDGVQLFDLMFKMRKVRLKLFDALGNFICHAGILPLNAAKVERGKETDWLFTQIVYSVAEN